MVVLCTQIPGSLHVQRQFYSLNKAISSAQLATDSFLCGSLFEWIPAWKASKREIMISIWKTPILIIINQHHLTLITPHLKDSLLSCITCISSQIFPPLILLDITAAFLIIPFHNVYINQAPFQISVWCLYHLNRCLQRCQKYTYSWYLVFEVHDPQRFCSLLY